MNIQPKTTAQEAQRVVDLLAKAPAATANKSIELAKKPVYRLRNSQILTGITGTTGLIIFALGVENLITNTLNVSSPYVEIVLGLFLLIVSGLALKKLI